MCVKNSVHRGGLQAHTLGGEVRGSGQGGLQAHTQRGGWGSGQGGCLQAHTWGKVGGSGWGGRSPGPYLGGLQACTWGDLQAHTQGVPRPTPGGSSGPPAGGVSQHALRPLTADGYCCGRYAFYWNAFLFTLVYGVALFRLYVT